MMGGLEAPLIATELVSNMNQILRANCKTPRPRKTAFLIICFFSYLSLSASLPCFLPPANWEAATPNSLSSYVQIGFVGKGSSEFRPSINLATEEVDVPLKQYVKAVKKIHAEETHTSWRDLGKFMMQAGEGRLTEITTSSPWGEVKMLQALFVKDHTAYILTGAALKQEFAQFQADFLKTFRSLSLLQDLFSPLPLKKKEQFNQLFAKWNDSLAEESRKEEWLNLQKATTSCPEMGAYWQFLVLKEGRTKIFQKEGLK